MFESAVPSGWQDPRWYVLFIRSNQESRVADALAARAVEHYLPCYTAMRQWKDRRVKLEMPLFPGYIFVRLPLMEKMKVLTVPNVVSLVGSSRTASEVAEEEILWIRRGLEHGTAQPHAFLNQGDRVVITSGVMSGMEGVLLRRQNGAKIVISIDSIFRAFVVEMDEACVRLVASRPPALEPGFRASFSAAAN